MFGLEVEPEERGKGVARETVIEFICHAKRVPGITRVRIGGGRNEAVTRIWGGLRREETALGIRVTKNNRVELVN